MTMADLATWSQLFSSLAVLITLVYLAIEVKQNTAALHAQTRQALLAGSQSELFEVIEHPEIHIIFTKTGKLETEEYIKLHGWLAAMVRAREFAWLQYRNGIIDEDQWFTEKGVIEFMLTIERNGNWWQEIGRFFYSPQFVAFVDTLIKDKPQNPITQKILNWEPS